MFSDTNTADPNVLDDTLRHLMAEVDRKEREEKRNDRHLQQYTAFGLAVVLIALWSMLESGVWVSWSKHTIHLVELWILLPAAAICGGYCIFRKLWWISLGPAVFLLMFLNR
jgi:CHASE2 domain-containing sensor protein